MRYEIDERGIKNKYIRIAWAEIESVVWVDDIKIRRYKHSYTEAAAVLSINGKEGSLSSQDPKKCIFLTKNKKNFDALRTYGRSAILKEFLDMYE